MGRKEQILEAAFEIVDQAGIEGLHARTVAARLGINHASVHYYFRTRSELLSALIHHSFDRLEAETHSLLTKAKTHDERVEAVLTQVSRHASESNAFPRNWASYFVASIADPELRKIMAQRLTSWLEKLEAELSEADASRIPMRSPDVLAATLVGVVFMGHAIGREYRADETLHKIAASLRAA